MLAPALPARTLRSRSVFACEPRYRTVKAVKVAARIPALHHLPLSLWVHVLGARRTTTSWSRL